MAIKVSAKQTLMYIGNAKGSYRFVMQPQIYSKIDDEKFIAETAARSGLPMGVILAVWKSIGEVIKVWITEGHSVTIPSLGSLRFGVRAKSVENADDVSTSLIMSRKLVFRPLNEIKKSLSATNISINCYDKDGNLLKRVNSVDDGVVDEDNDENQAGQQPSTPSTGGQTGDDDLDV